MTTETSKPQLLSTWDSQPAATQCYVIALFFERLLPSVRSKLADVHSALKSEYYRGRPVGWASKLIVDTFVKELQTQPAEWRIFCELVGQLYPGAVVQQAQPVKQDTPDWLTSLPQTLQIRLLAHGVAWQNLPSEDYPELRAKHMLSESDLVVIRFAAVTLQQMLDDGLLESPSAALPVPVAPVTNKLGTVTSQLGVSAGLEQFPPQLPTINVLAVLYRWIHLLKCKKIDVTTLPYTRPYPVEALRLHYSTIEQGHVVWTLLSNMAEPMTQGELTAKELVQAIASLQFSGDLQHTSEAAKFVTGIKNSPEFQRLMRQATAHTVDGE